MKDFYSEHLYTQHLDSTITCFCTYLSHIYPSLYESILLYHISEWQTSLPFPLNTYYNFVFVYTLVPDNTVKIQTMTTISENSFMPFLSPHSTPTGNNRFIFLLCIACYFWIKSKWDPVLGALAFSTQCDTFTQKHRDAVLTELQVRQDCD